ncbi:MAG TPA: hypothetical protein VGJ70_25340 [Solirubrobacteraceae bacterium]|jgi:hypothetical protein
MAALSNRKSRMQATLVRFGPDLLALVKAEAERSGVSVAQYVREATLARVAYTAGRRGDRVYDAALAEVTERDGAQRRRREIAAASARLRSETEARLAAKSAPNRRANGSQRG